MNNERRQLSCILLTDSSEKTKSNTYRTKRLTKRKKKQRKTNIASVIPSENCKASPVYTLCTGIAASMDAVIFAAGEKGHRYILPHFRVMIHEPLLQGGAEGSATSILRISESIQDTKRKINGLLAGFTGRTAEEIDRATPFDNYMSAEQAVEFGLCDRILDDFGEIFGKEVL